MSENQGTASLQAESKPAEPRVEPPLIYEGGEDGPLFGARDPDQTTSTTSNELSPADRLNQYRLSRGIELVMLCVVLIFLLACFSIPQGQSSEVIPMTLDTLKLITTTVIGFVFGSHTFSQKKDDNDK